MSQKFPYHARPMWTETFSLEGQFIVCHLVINTPLLTDTLIHVTEEQSRKLFIYMILYIQLKVS